MKCHALSLHLPEMLFFWYCSGHRLMSLEGPICLPMRMGKGVLEEPRCPLDGEELLEGMLDFCEEAPGICSAVFHRTDFGPTCVVMVTLVSDQMSLNQ